MDQALWYPVLRERKRDKPKWENKTRERKWKIMKNKIKTLTGKSYLESKEQITSKCEQK